MIDMLPIHQDPTCDSACRVCVERLCLCCAPGRPHSGGGNWAENEALRGVATRSSLLSTDPPRSTAEKEELGAL